MLKLRGYQTQIVEQVRSLMRSGERRILVVSPTGSGKTALTANMLGTAATRDMGSWFVVHRRELIKQSVGAFCKAEIPNGVVANGFPGDARPYVQVASVQTLRNRHDKIRRPKLIVWDEAHHVAAGTWSKIFEAYPDAFHVGLTATPERTDGKGLKDWFDKMVLGPRVEWLIRHGWLAPYKLFAPTSVNISHVHTRYGDFKKDELADAVDKPKITGDVIREYKKRALGKRAVVFCVGVNHSEHVADEFNRAGIRAAHIDGGTKTSVRDNLLRQFANGEIDVLCNVDLFGEGFDLPAIECCIQLRPTQSLGLHLQQVGRALRPAPNKEFALILDHVGNFERHGLPDDPRDWSLEGRAFKKGQDGPAVKSCPECFGVLKSHINKCPYCKHRFAKVLTERTIDTVEGELDEIDIEALKQKRKKEQAKAQTLEDLVEIGKNRGYKRPYLWAKHVYNARMAKRLKGV